MLCFMHMVEAMQEPCGMLAGRREQRRREEEETMEEGKRHCLTQDDRPTLSRIIHIQEERREQVHGVLDVHGVGDAGCRPQMVASPRTRGRC